MLFMLIQDNRFSLNISQNSLWHIETSTGMHLHLLTFTIHSWFPPICTFWAISKNFAVLSLHLLNNSV